MDRRDSLKLIGIAGVALPLGAVKPLTPEQYLVFRLVELIIPGATAAGVRITLSPAAREGLPAYSKFLSLTEPEQIEFLTPICKRADALDMKPDAVLFRDVKLRTIDAYYTTQAGLEGELGYKGNIALASFPGCTGEPAAVLEHHHD